ncbi:phosphotransferase family protein [Allorhizocola rhizosphaerae]|uniref:phosphotransferase family protein n=1 Tax=Allorhizocola rhizosphaerae TaxID=1872709 RepID=UPI000E3BA1E3|nr:phosphotransferase [Allorhizocola rhizosphaerae]
MSTSAPLAIGGNRLLWTQLPEPLRHEIEHGVGGTVARAISRPGGFSPGLASVLELDTGARVFAKAVSMQRNEFTAAAIRCETQVLERLPAHLPAPRPRWNYDDGEWVVLVTDAVEGHNPAQPWQPAELKIFLDAATVLAELLTPGPFDAPKLADATEFHVDGWQEATAGDTLLHGDLRSDNFLITETGFTVVDWPSVCLGAPWLDLLISLPSVAMHGGGDPEEIWSAHPLSRGVDPGAVDIVLRGTAKFFLDRSREPIPPLLPTIRDFQRAQGEIAEQWLRARSR